MIEHCSLAQNGEHLDEENNDRAWLEFKSWLTRRRLIEIPKEDVKALIREGGLDINRILEGDRGASRCGCLRLHCGFWQQRRAQVGSGLTSRRGGLRLTVASTNKPATSSS